MQIPLGFQGWFKASTNSSDSCDSTCRGRPVFFWWPTFLFSSQSPTLLKLEKKQRLFSPLWRQFFHQIINFCYHKMEHFFRHPRYEFKLKLNSFDWSRHEVQVLTRQTTMNYHDLKWGWGKVTGPRNTHTHLRWIFNKGGLEKVTSFHYKIDSWAIHVKFEGHMFLSWFKAVVLHILSWYVHIHMFFRFVHVHSLKATHGSLQNYTYITPSQ